MNENEGMAKVRHLSDMMARHGVGLLDLLGTGAVQLPIAGTDKYVVIGTLAGIASVAGERFEASATQTAIAAPVQAEQQWISVDDARKPEPRKPVLLFVRTLTRGEDDEGRPYETEGAQVEMGEYRHNNGAPYFDCYASPMSDNDWITHWMPLPAAPGATPSLRLSEQDVRDQALEDAAKVVEEEIPCSCCFSDDEVALAANLAAAIRTLKSPSTAQPSKE